MKKHLALFFAALMICLMAVPAFAGTQDEVDMGKVAFSIKKATKEWKPDGVINDGEYYEVPMKDTWFSYAWNDLTDEAETQSKNLGQKLYMSWDDQYVYTATTYTVPKFFNEYGSDPGNIWQACAIQNNFAPKADDVLAAGNRLEYGVGLTSDTNELVSTVWADTSDGNIAGWVPAGGSDFTVTHSNNVLTYEVRTPWNAFLGSNPKEGDVFGYCIVWAAGTDFSEYVHAQLASGCTGNQGKNAWNFAQVTLEAAPVVETEAPAAVEEPVTTTTETAPVVSAPKTADAFAVVVLVAAVTACGAYTLGKKRG
jgi:hypothetical protein